MCHLTTPVLSVQQATPHHCPAQTLPPNQRLQLALQAANHLIWRRERSEAELRLGPTATTVVAVIVDPVHLWWANVGDSRAYLVGEDSVERLTRDHSWVEDAVRGG